MLTTSRYDAMTVAAINDAHRAAQRSQWCLPSGATLRQLIAAAQGALFPDAKIALLAPSDALVTSESDIARLWREGRKYVRLLPIDGEDSFDAQIIDLEGIAHRGMDVAGWIPSNGWLEAQKWQMVPGLRGFEEFPATGSAISCGLHVGSLVRAFAVREEPFSKSCARRYLLDVGFFDPDPWCYAFLHRAAEVLGEDFEPSTASALIALARDEERAMLGHEAFNALRKRWYSRLMEHVLELAAIGEITMSKEAIADSFSVGRYDNYFATGESPEGALAEDRTYWED